MFKTKLMIAIAAAGFSAVASANIDGSTANGEFTFSAFDATNGVGYTYELTDAGFDDLFGSDVRMNSLIGSTNTSSAVGNDLLKNPVGGIVFDAALPSFTDFLSGAVTSTVVWNITSIDTSGSRRMVQTVDVEPSASPYTNSSLNASAAKVNEYNAAVNDLLKGAAGSDGYLLTVDADGAAYAGNNGEKFDNNGYDSFGKLDQTMALYVAGGTSSASNSTKSLFEQLLGENGNDVVAKVYMGNDGFYHLQIAVVPEPETYAMLLAGLGLIGFAARRKSA